MNTQPVMVPSCAWHLCHYFLGSLRAIECSGMSSRTTHNHPLAVDACRYYGGLIHGAVTGKAKMNYYHQDTPQLRDTGQNHPLEPEIDQVACGSFRKKNLK